jgi:F420-dependent oxidoreductase-like protein
MSRPIGFGFKASGQGTTIENLRAVWRAADQGGLDHIWDFDHFASIGAGGPDRPVFEGWALQAAMAVATSRVRLGCNVTGNTYRHPVQLAKLAVTVDHLSGGRLEFGIGAAWAEIEHRMYGWEGLDHRVGRLSESLRIIRSLWTEERTTFQGRHYRVEDAIANPKPVQRPHPPIWIGAGGDQTIRLVARHADVWNPSGAARERGDEYEEKLAKACEEIGRDPSTIRRAATLRWGEGGFGKLLEDAGASVERGFTEHMIYLPEHGAPAAAEAIVARLPELRALG